MATVAALAPLLRLLEGSLTTTDVNSQVLLEQLAIAERALQGVEDGLEPAANQHTVSICLSWLRAHEDYPSDPCMCKLLGITSKLLGHDQATDNIAIQKGLLSSVTALLAGPRGAKEANLARSCVEIIAVLSVVEDSDKILSRLNAVPCILGCMKAHSADTAVLEDAITALALMAKRTRHCRALQQGGGVATLVEVLKRYTAMPHLVVAICRCISNFTAKEGGCLAVFQGGGVEALMEAFDKVGKSAISTTSAQESLTTRAAVASALKACSHECPDVQQAILRSCWLASLAGAVRAGPPHAPLLEAAFGIVRGLCKHEANTPSDIMSLGFVKHAVLAMQQFNDDLSLQKEGCALFGSLAAASSPALREQLGESGVLEELVKAASNGCLHDDRKLAKWAFQSLFNLSSSDPLRNRLATTNVVSVLLMAARTFMDNVHILDQTIGVVSHLAVQESCGQQLVEGGAVQALLLFLDMHQGDLQVVFRSVVALHRLQGKNGPRRMTVLREIATSGSPGGAFKGLRLLVNAMQFHKYDGGLVKETALLLSSLTVVDSIMPAMMEIARPPCLQALDVHKNDPVPSEALTQFLAKLPLEDDEASWNLGQGRTTPGQSPVTSSTTPAAGFMAGGSSPLGSGQKAAFVSMAT